jgi:hypothetical protein
MFQCPFTTFFPCIIDAGFRTVPDRNGDYIMSDEEAFVESQQEEPRTRSPKSIKLSLNEDGSIDWENTAEKHSKAFINAVKVDPNGILDNIKEEAGTSKPDDEPEGIADATIVAAANAVMVVEALGITAVGPKFSPVLKNLHPIVAIKACSVSLEEMQPVMPECKRIIKRYVPVEYLGQEYQDLAVVGEHLLKLSAAKFKACVDLAIEIENMKAGTAHKPNGRVTIIEGNSQP